MGDRAGPEVPWIAKSRNRTHRLLSTGRASLSALSRFRSDLVAALFTTGLISLLMRNMFNGGLISYSDFFPQFPGVANGQGWTFYLSDWNPGSLGSQSAQPATYAILSGASLLGIPPVQLQASVVGIFLFAGGFGSYLLAKRFASYSGFTLLAPAFYLLTPVLFNAVFDSSSNIPLYGLLPLIIILGFEVMESPRLRSTLMLASVLGVAFAFVAFAPAFVLPLLVAIIVTNWVGSGGVVQRAGVWGMILALITGLTLNAPFYFENLPYFSGQGISGVGPPAIRIAEISYSWSTPVNLFSGFGSSLYPRYASYFTHTGSALLLLVFACSMIAFLDRRSRTRPLRLFSLMTIAGSIAWVSLTRLGYTVSLFRAVPYLLVYNYPEMFYMYTAVSIAALLPIALETVSVMAHRSNPAAEGPASLGSSFVLPKSGGAVLSMKLQRPRPAARLIPVVLLVFLSACMIVPSSFYLESGDFRVTAAPAAILFPAQWGAYAPPTYLSIANFLDSHGANLQARALILPFPGEQGGEKFRPYSVNLFDQPQYNASRFAGPFFHQGLGINFSNEVINYLVSNRTDEIGTVLGEASVKYVIVNLEDNSTGPAGWQWGSMTGSPDLFIKLLNQQRDLERVYNSSEFAAYLNLDYRGYVQVYSTGVPVVQVQPQPDLTKPVETVGLGLNNWSTPLPASRISIVSPRASGYNVSGVSGSGSMTISFGVTGVSQMISAVSSGFDNPGVYINTPQIDVRPLPYTLQFDSSYHGPSTPCCTTGYVTVFGFDPVNGSQPWAVTSYASGIRNGSLTSIEFDPSLLGPSATKVYISIAFPHSFGDGTTTNFTVWNMTLSLTLPSPPSQELAPLVIDQLPVTDPARGGLAMPMNSAALGNISSDLQDGTLRTVCLGACNESASTPVDQLFYVYYASSSSASSVDYRESLQSLGGLNVNIAGNSSSNLFIGSSPFRTIYMRASGNGTISYSLDGSLLASTQVFSSSVNWTTTTLPTLVSGSSFEILYSGNLSVDSVDLSAEPIQSPAPDASVSYTMKDLADYSVSLSSTGARFVLLAQGYNSGWRLNLGDTRIPSSIGAGWANLFVLPKLPAGSEVNFSIRFLGQETHEVFLTVQVTAIAGTVFGTCFPSSAGKKVRIAIRRITHILVGALSRHGK